MARAADPKPAPLGLALREIVGNITLTRRSAYAWFVVPPSRWAWRADSDRRGMIDAAGIAYAGLAGRRVRVRVTSRPYPVAAWARGLHSRTPSPLPGTDGNSWADNLLAQQRYLRTSATAEKEVYLGVEVAPRSRLAGLAERLTGKAGNHELAHLERDVELITEVVASPGIGGAAADTRRMEWLMHRSVGLGLPAPGGLMSPPGLSDTWETTDLHAFTEGVVIRPTPLGRCVQMIDRRPDHEPLSSYIAVVTLGRMPEMIVPDPRGPWLAATDALPWSVEVAATIDILAGQHVRGGVTKALLRIRDQQRQYQIHDIDEPASLTRQADHARRIEDEMSHGDDLVSTRTEGWYRLAVAGRSEAECMERVRAVRDLYKRRHMDAVLTKGQASLVREFIPGEPVSSTAYRRRLPMRYFAASLPQVATRLGDRRGPLIGLIASSVRRPVMFDTHYSTEIKKASGLVPIVGRQGAGKSVLEAAICYQAARRGIRTVMLDPSGPLAALCQMPELREFAEHIDLAKAPAGTLSPWAVVPEPVSGHFDSAEDYDEAVDEARAERKTLAIDIARMLLPAQIDANAHTEALLLRAIREVGAERDRSYWMVIGRLREYAGMNVDGSAAGPADPGHDHRLRDEAAAMHAQTLADLLADTAETRQGRLFFPPLAGGTEQSEQPRAEAVLTVITMSGLVLPNPTVPREHWSFTERMSVPALHLASWYATRAIYGLPRHVRKVLALDECHFLAMWPVGRALFQRVGRDTRKYNVCCLAASQDPADTLNMDVANHVAGAFVGRIEDEQVAADALRLLGVQVEAGYEHAIGTLSQMGPDGTPPDYREFVFRDPDGNVDRFVADLSYNPALLAVVNTDARPSGEPRSDLAEVDDYADFTEDRVSV
ncbi:MAG TPA: ATP-binding protein [Mycobacteriales bacterium]|nr:ATP-binding protein [Mycobacteriales bacterium]